MYTVTAKMPMLIKPKTYGFARASDAERFADKLQALKIPVVLGYTDEIHLDNELITAAPRR